MPIKVIYEKHNGEWQFKPVAICDGCDRRIEDAYRAGFYFSTEGPAGADWYSFPRAVLFFHHDCYRERKRATTLLDGYGWARLDNFPLWLARGMNMLVDTCGVPAPAH